MVKLNDDATRAMIKDTNDRVRNLQLILQGRPGEKNATGMIVDVDRLKVFRRNVTWAVGGIVTIGGAFLLKWAEACLFSH